MLSYFMKSRLAAGRIFASMFSLVNTLGDVFVILSYKKLKLKQALSRFIKKYFYIYRFEDDWRVQSIDVLEVEIVVLVLMKVADFVALSNDLGVKAGSSYTKKLHLITTTKCYIE